MVTGAHASFVCTAVCFLNIHVPYTHATSPPRASLVTPLVSIVHVRQAILTSRTHITRPQGSPGDAKNDLSSVRDTAHRHRTTARHHATPRRTPHAHSSTHRTNGCTNGFTSALHQRTTQCTALCCSEHGDSEGSDSGDSCGGVGGVGDADGPRPVVHRSSRRRS